MRQRDPPSTMNPALSAGIIPALISEDFPQPEGPVTARKWFRASRSRSWSVCASRPKKMSDSSYRNGRNPG
jgi:hypothetical protein